MSQAAQLLRPAGWGGVRSMTQMKRIRLKVNTWLEASGTGEQFPKDLVRKGARECKRFTMDPVFFTHLLPARDQTFRSRRYRSTAGVKSVVGACNRSSTATKPSGDAVRDSQRAGTSRSRGHAHDTSAGDDAPETSAPTGTDSERMRKAAASVP